MTNSTNLTISGNDILHDWSCHRIELKDRADEYIDVLAETCRRWYSLGQLNKGDAPRPDLVERHGKNLEAFMRDLSPTNRPVFWQKLVAGATDVDGMAFVISANPYLAPAICAAFGIPIGAPGIGVAPKTPL